MSRATSGRGKREPAAAPKEADALPGWPAPRENPHLFGHEAAEARFASEFEAGRLHHAWLIGGPPGIGKATLAFRLARRLLASETPGGPLAPDAALGPQSPLFRQVATLAHPGLFALRRPLQSQGDKFASVIPVDEVRRLKHFFETTAASHWRAAIIDRADDLNVSSANALLKLLEEPPARSVFLLVSSAPAGLFATVRSRCARLSLRPLDDAAMRRTVAALAALSGAAAPAAADLDAALALAEGSPRQALELLSGTSAEALAALRAVFQNLPAGGLDPVLAMLDRLAGAGAEGADRTLDILQRVLSQLARGVYAGASPPPGFEGAARLFRLSNLALWAGLWERTAQMRAEAERLNLDRAALMVTVFRDVQATALQASQNAA